jgi:heat shock protein HtpX
MGTFTNQLKTVLFLGLLTGLLLWLGSFFGRQGLTIALIFVFLMNFLTYFFSDKIVLAMYRAQPVQKSHWLYKMVHEVVQKANLPVPKVYIVPGKLANAFATGRSPKHAAVACTEGILELLSKEELRGVIAHEVSHIKNRDILIATVAATIAGAVSYLAQMGQWALMFGGGRDNQRGGNIFSLILLVIITPIIAMLIQLAISRSREYQADASGAKLIKTGIPLANALHKLEGAAKMHPMRATPVTEATSHLFIVNPFKGEGFISLFMTHPVPAERIKRLKEMKF